MLISRRKEYKNLENAYKHSQQAGKLQLCFITGEAGMGKTVLANMFMNEIAEDNDQTLFVSVFCCIRSEYNIPYQPFKELLKQLLQDIKNTEEQQPVEKTKGTRIKDALTFSAKMICDHAPDLIGSFIPGASIVAAIGQSFINKSENKKDVIAIDESKILEQYVDAIRAIAKRYKLVMFIDDLQWIDNLSVNLLYQLIMGLQNSPVMIIGCYRSTDIATDGIQHPMHKLLTEVKIQFGNVFINLDRQSKEERLAFMNAMLNAEANVYDTDFREKLFQRTNGNPLFVSELIGLLKENGMLVKNSNSFWKNNDNLEWNSYPVRIEGIIQERIGKLEESLLETLTYASVQGYRFIAQVLSKTMGEPERDMLVTLSKKLQKQYNLVYEDGYTRSGTGLLSHFNFSNYIFQQYLYHELSMSQRIMLHSDVAAILEELYKDSHNEVAADIAKHYELSGEYSKAIPYIRITVGSMIQLSAYTEAVSLIKKALIMLEEAEQTAETQKEKLHFLVQLCICYRSIKGWGKPEVRVLYERAKKLSKELREFEYINIILFGIWAIQLAKLNLDECLILARKHINAAQKHQNKTTTLTALISLVNTLFWLGKLTEADETINSFMSLIDEKALKNETNQLNHLLALMFSLLIAREQDNAEKAKQVENHITELVNTSRNRFYQVVGYRALAWYAFLSENNDALGEYSEKMVEQSKKYGFNFYHGIGQMFYGASIVDTNPAEAEHIIKQGYRQLTELSNSDVTAMHSVYTLILGKLYLKTQQHNLFCDFMKEEIKLSLSKNERCYLSEMHLLTATYYKNKDESKYKELLNDALRMAKENGSGYIENLILSS